MTLGNVGALVVRFRYTGELCGVRCYTVIKTGALGFLGDVNARMSSNVYKIYASYREQNWVASTCRRRRISH